MPLELELCPGRWVGGQHPCFIIAEIGQNHQGDLEVAKRMIRTAKVKAETGRKRAPAGGGAAGKPAAGSWDHLPLLLLVARVRPGVQLARSVCKSLESSSSLPTLLTCLHYCSCLLTRPLPPSGGRMISLKHRFDEVVPLPCSVVPHCPRVESKPFNIVFRTLMTWFLPAYQFSFLTSFSDIELLPASSEVPERCCGLSLAISCVWKMKLLKCQDSGFKFRRHHSPAV